MGKPSRDKGARAERQIAAYLSAELGMAVKRKLGASRQSQCDIDLGPFSIEVKARRSFAVSQFMRQAEEDCAGRTPVVVLREDGDVRAFALMRLADWVRLAREEIVKGGGE